LKQKLFEANGIVDSDEKDEKEKKETGDLEKKIRTKIRNLKIMFLLATAYSSNIGGTGVSKRKIIIDYYLKYVAKFEVELYCSNWIRNKCDCVRHRQKRRVCIICSSICPRY